MPIRVPLNGCVLGVTLHHRPQRATCGVSRFVDAVIEQAVVILTREDEAQRRRDWAKTCENASSFKPDR
jgi:hypothetical protein